MNPIVVDTETTTFQKGNPYSERNKLCVVGTCTRNVNHDYWIQYDDQPFGGELASLRNDLSHHDLFVAFNTKFDLAWLRRYGINLSPTTRLWDLQLVEFIITGQTTPYPSLENTCQRVGLPGKLGDIAEKYWDQGIDTPQIPKVELRDYVRNDCTIEWGLFDWQWNYLKDKPLLKRLCWDACQDVLGTFEMEWNGLLFDFQLAQQLGDRLEKQIADIDLQLNSVAPEMDTHWNSNDWLSAFLYGGVVFKQVVEHYVFTRKDGKQTPKTRKVDTPVVFPRQVEPLKNSAVKKDGFFQVNEGVLKRLKATGKAKQIIDLVLTRNKLEKKLGTYFRGWPRIYGEMDWTNNIIHGHLNHTVTVTGRLSSSNPNQQNPDPELLRCIKTRFPLKENNISTSP